MLEPRAVAVVGASRDASSIGRRILDALIAAGFTGPVYPDQPGRDRDRRPARVRIRPRRCPAGVDLAVIAVPRDRVLAVVDDCAAAGVKSLVVITAGFAEAGDEGRARQQELRRARARLRHADGRAQLHGAAQRQSRDAAERLVLSAVSAAGHVGLSSQSGALGLAILALAANRGVGLSTFVSVGNKADVSSNDLLEYWEEDPATRVILLYLESFGNPRRFARLARRIGRTKPIVAVKAGRTRAGSRAAGSHTAALAANDAAVDALFHQSGVIRADTIDEMFDIAACLDAQPLPAGRRVAIVTNAGGPGILAVDACESAGLTVAPFSAETRARLAGVSARRPRASAIRSTWSRRPDRTNTGRRSRSRSPTRTPTRCSSSTRRSTCTQSAATSTAIREGIAVARRAGAAQKPILACVMADRPSRSRSTRRRDAIPALRFPGERGPRAGKGRRLRRVARRSRPGCSGDSTTSTRTRRARSAAARPRRGARAG